MAATKSFSTCSASPVRSSPWSTKTQVSWWPMARWTSAAATAESTPPDSPQMAWAEPTWARIALDLLLDDAAHGPGRGAAGRGQEPAQHGLAVLGVQHLGVELDAVQAPAGVLGGGHRGGRRSGAVTVKPGGATVQPSPWDIHTCWLAGSPSSSTPGSVTSSVVAPYSPPPVRATSPPRPAIMSWKP